MVLDIERRERELVNMDEGPFHLERMSARLGERIGNASPDEVLVDRQSLGTAMCRGDGGTGVVYEKPGYFHWSSFDWNGNHAVGNTATWEGARAAVIAHWDKGA